MDLPGLLGSEELLVIGEQFGTMEPFLKTFKNRFPCCWQSMEPGVAENL